VPARRGRHVVPVGQLPVDARDGRSQGADAAVGLPTMGGRRSHMRCFWRVPITLVVEGVGRGDDGGTRNKACLWRRWRMRTLGPEQADNDGNYADVGHTAATEALRTGSLCTLFYGDTGAHRGTQGSGLEQRMVEDGGRCRRDRP